ncbi:sodium/proton antiporter NhaB [Marinibactrum halimedae]|uniref:Na(+)/H(+) antiporter NhaB n=1 Tax=Marinibactrum halimedae TaxID=1444977 RepID=A0AA37WP59_9GAMM|nr:sodium/proton antiporter NhaB [Marinibactrum halimedae]MCD9459476.1 sodium/proton antiporter NhaB [Marinibactrum halimedae]GLS28130.1 Na(+)/H(+) antiporter NhaB [Marinibactrum halimedae]
MDMTLSRALGKNFLGQAPTWYKQTIIAFLAINPILLLLGGESGPFITGWILIAEFIFTLAMALKCYPLQPGGLLAIEAVILGMTSPESVYHEIDANLEVILLLMFMVAGIYFMKNLLLFTFTKILLGIRSKVVLSTLFCFVAAVLSAFLDALTVTAVLISVIVGFYSVYHKVASGKQIHHDSSHDHGDDSTVIEYHREDLESFRAFLRSLIMHGAIGTALGGVCTLVGEPQNLLIAERAGWEFLTFVEKMAPVTMPALAVGLITCVVLELTGWFGYGAKLSKPVRMVLEEFDSHERSKRSKRDVAQLIVQGIIALLLVVALATHVAEVGLIGLSIIVLLTAFNGIIEEHQIGHAFEEALPFTALLVVFFAVVAVIHEQHLFSPITHAVLSLEISAQAPMLFLANGILSMISDNVFVATVYINEVADALAQGQISREHFEKLAIAINTGTNLPSVATPNGQAAFLFLLTSALAPLIRLSYGRMVLMALPYTIVLLIVGLTGVTYFI